MRNQPTPTRLGRPQGVVLKKTKQRLKAMADRLDLTELLRIAQQSVVKLQVSAHGRDVGSPHVVGKPFTSTGSGFLVRMPRGSPFRLAVLTAAHVVQNAYSVQAQVLSSLLTGGGRRAQFQWSPSRVRAIIPELDAAVLEIPALSDRRAPPFLLGSLREVKVGSRVFALGFPLGQSVPKVSEGRYSGFQDGHIQHTSAISPGNSGGPLLDEAGHVVGINVLSLTRGNSTFWATPIDFVMEMLADVDAPAWAERDTLVLALPKMGVQLAPATPATARALGTDDVPRGGVYVQHVAPGSPAREVGLAEGDLVVSLNGEPIDSRSETHVDWYDQPLALLDVLRMHVSAKKSAILGVWVREDRHGPRMYRDVAIVPSSDWFRGSFRVLAPGFSDMDYSGFAGIVVAPLTKLRDAHPLTQSLLSVDELARDWLVVLDVVSGSEAHLYKTMVVGDVLDKCCGAPVRTLAEYRTALMRGAQEGRFRWETRSGRMYAIDAPGALAWEARVASEPTPLYKPEARVIGRLRVTAPL